MWVILLVLAIAPAASVYLSLRQTAVYESSAEVLLRYENLAGALTGVYDPSFRQDPARIAETQARLASTPAVAERALADSGLTAMTADEILDSTTVSASPDADLLTFSVRAHSPAVAEKLATAYARAYTLYRQELDTGAIVRARQEAEQRIAQLKTDGQEDSTLYQSLVDKAELLSTAETLQTQNAYVIRTADPAGQVEPKPLRNGLLAAALGLVLGVGLAFLWETLDTRVRSAEEIHSHLVLPLLGRLPAPPRRTRNKNRLVALGEPAGAHSEAFRRLRTNLEFVNLDRNVRSIMVTSAVTGEGKSTTVANLAVTLARSGHRVVLVDLDLRQPFLHRFFDLDQEPGLTDAVLGHVDLEEVVVKIALSGRRLEPSSPTNGKAPDPVEGLLEVLPAGPIPPDPGEFVTTAALASVLDRLRRRADILLIDTPPLLSVGDAHALSARVDGLLLVTRLNTLRRPMLGELHRILAASPAVKLGFVLAGAEHEEGYGGDYYYSARPREPQRVT